MPSACCLLYPKTCLDVVADKGDVQSVDAGAVDQGSGVGEHRLQTGSLISQGGLGALTFDDQADPGAASEQRGYGLGL